MACKKCRISENTEKQLLPKGSKEPEIYIIGDTATVESSKNGVPFDDRAGSYLQSVCNSLSIDTDNARFFNLLRCVPLEEGETTRKPTEEEITNCSRYLISDILKTKPKLIITLGSTVNKYFFDKHLFPLENKFKKISNIRGNVYNLELNDFNFKIIPTFDPSYILKRGKEDTVQKQFFSDLKKAKQLVMSGDLDIFEEGESSQRELLVAETYSDFKRFCVDEVLSSDMISFDIESNYKHPLARDARVVGFSVASSSKKGLYVVFESLEYEMPEKDKQRINKFLKKVLPEKTLLVHNAKMEVPFILNWLGIELTDIEDTMIQSRLLLGGQSGAGLKNQAMQLGYDDWSQDLDKYREYLLELYKRLKMTHAGNPRDEFYTLKETKSLVKVRKSLEENDKFFDGLNNRQQALYHALGDMIDILKRYYPNGEFARIEKVLADRLIDRINLDLGNKGEPESYGWVPGNIITKYGALDATAPFDVYESNLEEMDTLTEELGVDLYKGYRYWKQHILAGHKLELNGAYWDEGVVERELGDILPVALEAHESMVSSPLIREDIFQENRLDFSVYLFEYYLGDLIGWLQAKKTGKYYTSVEITDAGEIELDREEQPTIVFSPKKTYIGDDWFKIGSKDAREKEVPTIFDYLSDEDYVGVFDKYLANRIKELKNQEDVIETQRLKPILNPRSTRGEFREVVEKCIITSKVKITKIYIELSNLVKKSSFDIDDYSIKDRKALRKFRDLVAYEGLEPMEKINLFAQKIVQGHTFEHEELKEIEEYGLSFSLDSLSEDEILEIYECYVVAGVDVDDESTWDENFRWLYSFRVYKKIAKLFSSYVKGKVGRKSVWVVDKEDFINGKKFIPRERSFYENRDNRGNDELDDNEIFLYQPSFSVCTAETGRWRSGFHCLTGDTKIRLLDGRDATIKTIMKEREEGKDHYIYSVDNSGDFIVEKMNDLLLSGYTDTIAKITLDNGEVIKSTPDHRFMRRDGSYVEAQDMVERESMFPGYFKVEKVEIVKLEEKIPVYDLVINEETPCFLLSAGIVSHNTIPWSSAPQRFLTSRFKGGTIAKPDFCLTGDTEILLANGDVVDIKDLVDEEEFYVYSYDEDKGTNEIGKGHSCRMVRETTDLIEITLNTGDRVRCTPEHKFYHKDKKKFMEAKDLVEEDSLQSIDFRIRDNYFNKGKKEVYQSNLDVWELCMDLADRYNLRNNVYDKDKGTCRHHKDYNKLNDSPENIVRLTKSEHDSLHAKQQWRNPEYRELMLETSKKHGAQALRGSNYDPECIEKRKQGQRNTYKERLKEALSLLCDNGYHVLDIYRDLNYQRIWDNTVRDLTENKRLKKGYGKRSLSKTEWNNLYEFLVGAVDVWKEYVDDADVVLDELEFRKEIEEQVDSSVVFSRIKNQYKLMSVRDMEINEENWNSNIAKLKDEGEVGTYHGTKVSSVKEYFGSFERLHNYCKDNHRVVKIERVKTDKPVKTYCFTVDKFHNFYLNSGVLSSNSQMEVRALAAAANEERMLSDFRGGMDAHLATASGIFDKPVEEISASERRFAKGGTFSITYGAGIDSFAESYCDGDLEQAQQVFDRYFKAYPNIEKWIEKKHQEYKETGKVTLFTGRFINIISRGSDWGDDERALRQSQNYPIQGASSDLVGSVLWEIIQFIERSKYRSKVFGFIHDSIEIDIHPEELLELNVKILDYMNVYPEEEFNVPAKADQAIGASLGEEIEVLDSDTNSDFTEGMFVMEGWEDEIDRQIKDWRECGVFRNIEVEVLEREEKFISKKELFIKKRAFTKYAGQDRVSCKKKAILTK